MIGRRSPSRVARIRSGSQTSCMRAVPPPSVTAEGSLPGSASSRKASPTFDVVDGVCRIVANNKHDLGVPGSPITVRPDGWRDVH